MVLSGMFHLKESESDIGVWCAPCYMAPGYHSCGKLHIYSRGYVWGYFERTLKLSILKMQRQPFFSKITWRTPQIYMKSHFDTTNDFNIISSIEYCLNMHATSPWNTKNDPYIRIAHKIFYVHILCHERFLSLLAWKRRGQSDHFLAYSSNNFIGPVFTDMDGPFNLSQRASFLSAKAMQLLSIQWNKQEYLLKKNSRFSYLPWFYDYEDKFLVPRRLSRALDVWR